MRHGHPGGATFAADAAAGRGRGAAGDSDPVHGRVAASAAVVVWTEPDQRSTEDLRTDLATGRVTWYAHGQLGDLESERQLLHVGIGDQSNPEAPVIVAWSTGWGRLHVSAPLDSFESDFAASPNADLLDELDRLAARQGLQPMPAEYYAWRNQAANVLTAGSVLSILVLGLGPQPRHRTKWAQAWVLLLLPSAIGTLWWLASEAPWSRRAAALPEPLPHGRERTLPGGDRRITGGRSFITMLLLGFVISSAASLALSALQ